jgi:hypothetical protein
MPTYFLDPIGGNDANDGLSFANRWRTIGGGPTAARVAPGDEVRFIESPAPTLIGNCTWTNNARTFTVPAGVVKLVDTLTANTGWVAASNVVLNSPHSLRLIGAASVNFTPQPAFTTGKLAHKPLTMDLSGFRQVNVWLRATSPGLAAGSLFLDLCSDETGDSPIVSVPMTDGSNTNAWFAGLVAHTGSIGAINSIALRATADPGIATIIINNLWASKAPGSADEITLATMVSKTAYTTSPPLRGSGSKTGEEPLLGVMGVLSDTSVVLNRNSNQDNGLDNVGRGYDGVTETAATYAHQCVRFAESRNWTPNRAATQANPIIWTGGWSAADMATRTGMTRYMLSSRNYSAGGFAFHRFENFAFSSALSGNTLPGSDGCRVVNCLLTACGFGANNAIRGLSAVDTCYSTGSISLGGLSQPQGNLLQNIYSWVGGVTFAGGRSFLRGITVRNSGAGGVNFNGNPGNESICADDLVTLNNQSGGIAVNPGVNARIRNALINEATEVLFNGQDGLVSVENLDNVAGNDVLAHPWGRMTRQTTVVDTQLSSLRVQVTSTNAIDGGPMRLPLGQFEITLGVTTAIAIRMRRDNTGLSMGLSYLPTEGLPGITTEQRALMTAAANTWETVTLSLSPTGSGTQIISLDVVAWGGTTFNGYLEAITVT